MISYIILILFLITLLIIIFLKIKDILSPSVLSISFYALAIILAFIGTFSWNSEKELSLITLFLIIIGILSFTFGELFQRKFEIIEKTNNKDEIKEKKIDISICKILLTILFIITSAVLMIFQIKKVCNNYGYSSNNIGELLSYYRYKSNLFSNSLTDSNDINIIVKQMNKMCVIIGIILSYVFSFNYFHGNNNIKNKMLLIPIVLSMVETLLSSGRALFMKIAITFIFLMLFFYLKTYENKISLKLIFKLFLIFTILGITFFLILPIVGRSTTSNFIEYITFYLGCGIPSLNTFLNNMPEHSALIGEETFEGIYLMLNKLHILKFTRISAYSWVFFNGLGSNIFTSFRAYYFDFGWIGLIICQLIYGFFSTKFYRKVKQKQKSILVPIYAYFSCTYIEQIRAEQFFGLISSTTISYLVYFIIFYWLLVDKKFIFKLLKKLININ